MSQVTLYLDNEAEQLLRQSAQAASLANREWPAELIALAGAFSDFPLRDGTLQQTEDRDLLVAN